MELVAQIRRYLAENFLFSNEVQNLDNTASFLRKGIIDSIRSLADFIRRKTAPVVLALSATA